MASIKRASLAALVACAVAGSRRVLLSTGLACRRITVLYVMRQLDPA